MTAPQEMTKGRESWFSTGHMPPSRTAKYSVVKVVPSPSASPPAMRMEQSGFRPDQQQAYQGAKGGWQRFVAALEQVVARID